MPISRVVLLGAGLTITSALLLLAAPHGYRLGIFSLRLALQTLLRWGVNLAVGAAVVSLVGLIITLATPKERRRGLLLAAVSLVVAAGVIAIPGRFRMGPPAPPIHDITTDTRDPPQYVAAGAHRPQGAKTAG
jgi:MFS family permease